MIRSILSWITGSGFSDITKELISAYENKSKAQNDVERIEADKQIAYIQARQSLLIAEQRSYATHWIRPTFAFLFIIYDAKIILWDKVLNLGTTEPLSPAFWQLQMFIFGAYFLTRPLEKR